MSFEESDIKELKNKEDQVLGADFCSGYTDTFGKWNTGFDCPRVRNGETVYCCGTSTYKYCCTRGDKSNSGLSQTVILGLALGSVLVIAFLTLVCCLICRKCVPYRRGHPSLNGGPLYTMQCSSTTSGMANMYTFSGPTSALATPMDNSHVLVDLNATEFAYSTQVNSQRGISQHMVRGGERNTTHHSEPPPPYNEQCPPSATEHDIRLSDQPISFAMQMSCEGATSNRPANGHRRTPSGNVIASPNPLYWSTKF